MQRIAAVLLALWAGSLVTLCGMVAPMLFATLGDRHLAGQTAARLFQLEAWIGACIGAAVLALLTARRVPASALRRSLPLWLVVGTAAAPLLGQLTLRPMMERARLAGEMGRFAALHGGAALLFLAACAGALALLWRLNRPAG